MKTFQSQMRCDVKHPRGLEGEECARARGCLFTQPLDSAPGAGVCPRGCFRETMTQNKPVTKGKSFPSSVVPSAGAGNGETLTSRKNQLSALRWLAEAMNKFKILFAIKIVINTI